jgi:bacteriorhodopsin
MDTLASVVTDVAKHHLPPPAEVHQHITSFGANVLWVTFIAFFVTFVVFAAKTFALKSSERANAYTSLFLITIAAIAYYSMATGLGVSEERRAHTHTYRQLFYARYVDWVFTTPLLLLELVLLSGLDLGTTLWIIGADIAMIVTGLFGALETGAFKWGWFFAGCLFMVFVLVGLLKNGRESAFRRNSDIGNLYSGLSISLLVLWCAYPIVWAASEGKAVISSDKEVLCYAVLDILAKIVFSTIIFIKHPIVVSANAEANSRLDEPLLGAAGSDAL